MYVIRVYIGDEGFTFFTQQQKKVAEVGRYLNSINIPWNASIASYIPSELQCD